VNSNFIVWLFLSLAIGGAAIWAWPRYGSCLTHEGEVELSLGQSRSVACDQADLRFADWSHGATLELTCADREAVTLHLAESSPTGAACGVEFELLEHWVGGPRSEHQLALAYGW
jgi:hypothetical protein